MARVGWMVTESHQIGSSRYDLCLIPCGKPTCGKCPHGPYWYVTIQLRNGKVVKRYIGKDRPSEVPDAAAFVVE